VLLSGVDNCLSNGQVVCVRYLMRILSYTITFRISRSSRLPGEGEE
jgi:hypothetical protein